MAKVREIDEAVVDGEHVAAPKYFVADAVADIADAPKYPQCAWGSWMICAEDKHIYILRKSNVWEVYA